MRYYLPPAVFLAFGLYARWRFGDVFRDATVVTHPENRLWHPFRVFDDAEWTPVGRAVRRQFLRVLFLGFVCSLGIGVIVANIP